MGMGYLKDEGVDSFVNKRILANVPRISDTKNPGSFRINENKININIISHTAYAWHKVREMRGALLSDTSFVIFYNHKPGYPDQNDSVVYHFVPADIKPDSTNWLMKRKWYKGK